jgi:glycosyltransferase involved in cell wall biosynthesis
VYVLYEERSAEYWNVTTVREFGRQLPISSDFLDRLRYRAWEPPSKFDTILSSSLVTKAVSHHSHQKRIHLAHGFHRGAFHIPPRNEFSDNPLVRILQKHNRNRLQTIEAESFKKVDELIVNSEFTEQVIQKFYDITPDHIIYPPIETEMYYSDRPTEESFYLYLGRLSEVKGVKEIVRAFSETDHRLVVAGDGSLRDTLVDIAADNVEIVGYVSDNRKRKLMARCNGFIQNSIVEDFGITTVEAVASGAPTIAVNRQNNPNIVNDGQNGMLFEPSKITGIKKAVDRAANFDWDHQKIQESADKYDASVCREQWESVLNH